MEGLTQQQMVLLTILVSFIISIATSITIVSILTDTVPTLPQTINRIVEKTIETVTSSTTTAPLVTIKPTPTILSEEEQTVAAVQANSLAMVRIWSIKTETSDAAFLGDGFALDGGYIVTTKNNLGADLDFMVEFSNKKSYPAKEIYADKDGGALALLQLTVEKNQPAVVRTVLLSSKEPELGQTVLSLGGGDASTLGKGVISDVVKSETSTSSENRITKILQTIPLKTSDSGGPLFRLDGKVIGMNVVSADGEKYTVPVSFLKSILQDLQKTKPAESIN